MQLDAKKESFANALNQRYRADLARPHMIEATLAGQILHILVRRRMSIEQAIGILVDPLLPPASRRAKAAGMHRGSAINRAALRKLCRMEAVGPLCASYCDSHLRAHRAVDRSAVR